MRLPENELDYQGDLVNFTKLATVQTLIELGLLKPYISRREAVHIYPVHNVDYWIDEGLIRPIKDGSSSDRYRFNRVQLEALQIITFAPGILQERLKLHASLRLSDTAKAYYYLLLEITEESVKDRLSKLGLSAKLLNKSQAYKLYGRGLIGRWEAEGLIEFINGRIERSKIDAIASTSNVCTYLYWKDE